MKEYKGPKTYNELLLWAIKWRNGPKTERLGQAFFNEFDFEFKLSYNTTDPYHAMTLLEEGLLEKYPEFYQ